MTEAMLTWIQEGVAHWLVVSWFKKSKKLAEVGRVEAAKLFELFDDFEHCGMLPEVIL